MYDIMDTTIKLPTQIRRSPMLVALYKRHGSSKVIKDRRVPRSGARNRQRDYREEKY